VKKIRVMLADDHAILRAGLRMLLDAQPDMAVVAEAADGEEAIRRAGGSRPDVAVVDLTMPGLSGVETLEGLRREAPATRLLVLTMHDDPGYARLALAAGASSSIRAQIGAFGEQAGIALQMLDDLSSIASRRDKAREDLAQARPTWPWAWLAEQDEPFAWARCTHELAHIVAGRGDPDALADMLVDRVASIGRTRARATLDAALAPLGPGRDALAAELHAMEHMYG